MQKRLLLLVYYAFIIKMRILSSGEQGINLVHLGMKDTRPMGSWKPISEVVIKEGLELVLQKEAHPIIVLCASGIHQTGLLVGCLRKLQGWLLTSVLHEYRFDIWAILCAASKISLGDRLTI